MKSYTTILLSCVYLVTSLFEVQVYIVNSTITCLYFDKGVSSDVFLGRRYSFSRVLAVDG